MAGAMMAAVRAQQQRSEKRRAQHGERVRGALSRRAGELTHAHAQRWTARV
jgi:hypothetical protein